MKLPQKVSFGTEACEIRPKVDIWGTRRTGFPTQDSPLFYRASTNEATWTQAKGLCNFRFHLNLNLLCLDLSWIRFGDMFNGNACSDEMEIMEAQTVA